jgi:hypothetical protein
MDILDRIVEAVAQKLIYMRLDELSGETLSNYVKKAEGKGKPAKGSNRHVGITRAKLKLSRAASGSNKRKNVLGSKSKGNKAYIASHKKEGASSKPLSIDQINQMGVRKTHSTAENDAAETRLAKKTDALAGSATKDAVRQGKQDKKNRLELMKQIHRKRQAAKAAGKKS